MNNEPLVIERTYKAPMSKVWTAITDPDEMKKWYFDLPGFTPEVGFEIEYWGGDETKKYLHYFKVTEVIPGSKIAYSWRYDGIEGNSVVTFELFEEGDKTRLKLTHVGLETFRTDNPDFARASFTEGWNHLLGTGLANFLEQQ